MNLQCSNYTRVSRTQKTRQMEGDGREECKRGKTKQNLLENTLRQLK